MLGSSALANNLAVRDGRVITLTVRKVSSSEGIVLGWVIGIECVRPWWEWWRRQGKKSPPDDVRGYGNEPASVEMNTPSEGTATVGRLSLTDLVLARQPGHAEQTRTGVMRRLSSEISDRVRCGHDTGYLDLSMLGMYSLPENITSSSIFYFVVLSSNYFSYGTSSASELGDHQRLVLTY